MPEIPVNIKHAGRVYPLKVNTDAPATDFKQAVYEATGVPVDRVKIMVKGGVLKDDHDWSKAGIKEGQTLMVIGAAGPLPKAPEKPVVFLEDMDDAELASASAPVGLLNLGNTCYMNATVQALRAIPELRTALDSPAVTGPLPVALRGLYSQMSQTTDSVLPMQVLTALRTFAPQFAERARGPGGGSAPSAGLTGTAAMMGAGGGFAQQDAEECWGALVQSIKEVPGISAQQSTEATAQGQEGAAASSSSKKFVEQFLTAQIKRELKCDEAPEEEPSVSYDTVTKVDCNITINTNFMHSGIMDSLDQKIEKNSPTLNRDAVYTQHSRLARLPSYLTVHMVRFAWRRDINKKAKIMRKVKFPAEYDALDLVTPELKEQLQPVARRLKEIARDRAERAKVRRRTKAAASSSKKDDPSLSPTSLAPPPIPAPIVAPVEGGDVEMAGAPPPDVSDEPQTQAGGELEPEVNYRRKELAELEALVSPEIKADTGASVSGLYELVAIVTHKGAAADAGHYIGFVKKSMFAKPDAENPEAVEADDDWYKFDDDKVSIFPAEKLSTLDGGGQDASAYVLLYRSKPLA